MEFYKSCSSGNDFILIEAAELAAPPQPRQIQNWCDRHQGAGADGVVVYNLKDKPVSFRIYNQDGLEAELSGNGMAGLTALLVRLNLTGGELEIGTKAGIYHHRLLGCSNGEYHLEIDLGVPDFHSLRHFPFLKRDAGCRAYTCRGHHFYPVCIGNPQVVLMATNPQEGEELLSAAEELHQDSMFPFRTNVSVVRLLDPGRAEIAFFERGVGPTQASSTGTAGAYAVLRALNAAMDSCLFLPPAGGAVRASGREKICLENRTCIVYKGEYLESSHA